MTQGSLQRPQLRQVRAVVHGEPHQETRPDAIAAEAELEGWRRNDVRFFAHRVDMLERQLNAAPGSWAWPWWPAWAPPPRWRCRN